MASYPERQAYVKYLLFKTSKELAISLISNIFQKDSNLLELARNPGSLCMLCILHKDKIPIHAMNREELYEEYVAFLLSRWEERQNPEGEKTPRSQIMKKYHEILLKFGKLADINRKSYKVNDQCKHKSDDEDSMELSFTLDQIKSIVGEDAFNYGYLYKSHPSSRLLSSRYSFIHKTLHEFILAYFIKHNNLESFKLRLYKNRYLLKQELSLTRFLLHLYMSPQEAFDFTTNIIQSKPDKDLFIVLLKVYAGYQHDEYQTTLTFNTTEDIQQDTVTEYIYIYQYPCYVIRADRRHQDSLSSYNKDMIRRMNTDNKHKTVTVPILQTAREQEITCGDSNLPDNDFCVCCRPDYEVSVTGGAGKLKLLDLFGLGKMGDIDLNPFNVGLWVNIRDTNLHGHDVLTKSWMALIWSLRMYNCKLETGDISVIADSIQACTSLTVAESASPCRLQELNLGGNFLSGAGTGIAKIIPLCTEINLIQCALSATDISVIADSIQGCTSPTGPKSASPCRLQKLCLAFNFLRGAGADIARIITCLPLCTAFYLEMCFLNNEDFHAIVNAVIQTQSDRHTSVHDHRTPDRRQTSRSKPANPRPASHDDRRQTSKIKPASPGPASHTDRRQTSRTKSASRGPASHIEDLRLFCNQFSDAETVRLLLDNLPPSLRLLILIGNQFNKEEIQEIRRTYKDKYPNLTLAI